MKTDQYVVLECHEPINQCCGIISQKNGNLNCYEKFYRIF